MKEQLQNHFRKWPEGWDACLKHGEAFAGGLMAVPFTLMVLSKSKHLPCFLIMSHRSVCPEMPILSIHNGRRWLKVQLGQLLWFLSLAAACITVVTIEGPTGMFPAAGFRVTLRLLCVMLQKGHRVYCATGNGLLLGEEINTCAVLPLRTSQGCAAYLTKGDPQDQSPAWPCRMQVLVGVCGFEGFFFA